MKSHLGSRKMRLNLGLAALVLATSATSVSCGGDGNELSGSIGEAFSLVFDSVNVRKQADDLIIEYIKDVNGVPNKVCKVVVETRNLGLGDDTRLRGEDFLARVQLSRIAGSGGDFPGVTSGQIEFGTFEFKAGGKLEGSFSVVFDNGRTLAGSFSGIVQDVPLD